MGLSTSFGAERSLTGKQFRRGSSLGDALVDLRDDIDDAFVALETQVSTAAPADAGAGGAIPVDASGIASLTSAGVEARTLADPTFLGQRLSICCDVFVGIITVTAASALNAAGALTAAFGAAGEYLELQACQVGGVLVWRIAGNDGVLIA